MKRRTKVLGVLFLVVAAGITTAALSFNGCAQSPRLTGNLRATAARSQKLMALAAEEATAITDVDARLTRQLNLADMQIQRNWPDDAKVTLDAARKTLGSEDSKKLNDHARISGWVSVSELSRAVKDTDGANTACDGAIKAVREIEDPAVRCEYVMGICNEMQYLKGKAKAADLLAEAGPWTKNIDQIDHRRLAVVSFAGALFNLDDFAKGQAMLKNEDDAAWRSDTLTQLASMPVDRGRSGYADSANEVILGAAVSAPSRATTSPGSRQYFGQKLNYREVFQGQFNSKTLGR